MDHSQQRGHRLGTGRAVTLVAISLLLALGCTLRFYHLGTRSLWSDELFTMAIAQYHPIVPEPGQPWFKRITIMQISDGDAFLTAKAGEETPPLHDLIVKASVNLLGATEFAARLPAAVASCVLLAWFAWFAVTHPDARIRRTLLWALLLLTLSPSLLTYSHDARAYSLGTSLLGMAGLLWMLRWRMGWRRWSPPGWGEIALFTLATYTHYNAAALVALLLGADAVMATLNRSLVAWRRLLVVGAAFCVWLFFGAHTILYTAGGEVAWGEHSMSENVVRAITDATASLHPPWLAFVLLLCGVQLAVHVSRRWSPPRGEVRALLCLFILMVAYVAIAGTVAAKTGMADPRYYLFIVPAALVAFSLVLVQLEQRWQVVSAAIVIVIVALALPEMRSPAFNFHEAYREMTEFAVADTDEDVVYLFPWAPNRDVYRYYLDRLRGEDSRSHMVAINGKEDVARVCERLRSVRHVVVVAHVSGRERIDWVYAACGDNWPYRDSRAFPATFSEHWRAAPVASPPGPAT
jgi:hypothetical protein